MKITIFATVSKEHLYEKAESLGMSEQAAHYFSFFNEIPVDIEVDKDTGQVLSASTNIEYSGGEK